MTRQEILDYVSKRHWFHSIDLGQGIVTPGTRERDAWQAYKLPERLDGKKVLDIGAWEGQFSFEAERRGAAQVVAMDVWGTKGEPGSIGEGWENFQFVHGLFNSKVIPEFMNVYSLSPSLGPFDVILFLQVLYHLQDPLGGMRHVKSALLPGGMVCLETWVDAEWVDSPAAIFYPHGELNGDTTSWWGPNIKCVQALASAAGFKSCDLVWERQDGHFGGRGKRACFHLT